MTYDITKPSAPKMPNLDEVQNVPKFCSRSYQKICKNPSFRCFSPYFALISATRKFSTPTAIGRSCAVKWPIWWPIRGVIRANETHPNQETPSLPQDSL